MHSILHNLVPSSLRDIGNGTYHLIKGDASSSQRNKLAIGATRVAAAAATAFAILALSTLFSPMFAGINAGVILISAYFADPETASLLIGSCLAGAGVTGIAAGINLLAIGAIKSAFFNLVIGTVFSVAGWTITRIPKDIRMNDEGFMTDRLESFGNSFGSMLK